MRPDVGKERLEVSNGEESGSFGKETHASDDIVREIGAGGRKGVLVGAKRGRGTEGSQGRGDSQLDREGQHTLLNISHTCFASRLDSLLDWRTANLVRAESRSDSSACEGGGGGELRRGLVRTSGGEVSPVDIVVIAVLGEHLVDEELGCGG